jgi:hypothetical protein
VDADVPQRAGVVRLSRPGFRRRWPFLVAAIAWVLLLALLPWWLGLPLLLAPAAALLARVERLDDYAGLLRRALRWGLPGWLASLLLALGADTRAWVLALLAALAGFSLLMLLEGWLDRDRPRPPSPSSSAEWSELAMAPVGPAATIIELQPPVWLEAGAADPRGGTVRGEARTLLLADGTRLEGVEPRCSFSADGRWLAAPLAAGRGVVLQDRQRGRLHRLRGWQLCGWHDGQPWLNRGGDGAPLALAHVLGHDDGAP